VSINFDVRHFELSILIDGIQYYRSLEDTPLGRKKGKFGENRLHFHDVCCTIGEENENVNDWMIDNIPNM